MSHLVSKILEKKLLVSVSMTAFFPEKLVPFIRVTRGLRACDNQQQFNVLQQLPELFKKHDVTSVLTDIILAGIRNPKFYKKIPAALLVNINASLPSDDQLHLKDSIYESRLVEEPNEDKAAINHKKKRLPLNLLRIPSDLQYHLFHFLNYKELTSVQKVCRALCIAARNPSSIYSMELDHKSYSGNHKLLSEWLSRPRSLGIFLWRTTTSPDLIVGNTKWGQQVTHLSISCARGVDLQNLGHFDNLTKCEIHSFPDILLNGQITSYFTLKELSLEGYHGTENVVDEIRKFQNLEHLSLEYSHHRDDNENEIANCSFLDPISLPKLRTFSIKFHHKLHHLFLRILIGSHPDTVSVEVPWMHEECIFPQSSAALRAIRAVNYLNIDVRNMGLLDALHPLLERAQIQDKGPFFEECTLTFHIECDQQILLPPISTLFQCAKQSKLELRFFETDLSPKYDFERFVKEICSAPYGTFNEIKVNLYIGIITSKMDDVDWCQGILNALEDEECSKADRQTVRSLVMKSIDKLEEWVRAWLVFDEKRMKDIGLRKLDIEFKCNLSQDNEHWVVIDDADWNDEVGAKAARVDDVLDDMAGEWIQQRAERWSDIDKRCNVKVNPEKKEYGPEYKVSFTLQ